MGIEFEKVEKVNVVDVIVKQIIEKILAGEWKSGDKLPSEAELIEAFGASKYAVRNVLAKLNSMGVIETRQGCGSFVCSLYSVDYLKPLIPIIFTDTHRYVSVAEFRMGIEPEAARLAAVRATDEQIFTLKKTFLDMQSCQNDIPQYAELDMGFHVQIARASGNMLFEQSLNIIKMLYVADVEAITDVKQMEAHRKIYEALEARDPEKAAAAMRKHIEVVVRNTREGNAGNGENM